MFLEFLYSYLLNMLLLLISNSIDMSHVSIFISTR